MAEGDELTREFVRTRDDIANGYLIFYYETSSDCSVDVKIYEAIQHPDGSCDIWDGLSTKTIEKADVHIQGYIKWDGCSNFDLCVGAMYHFCGTEDVDELAWLLKQCYKTAEGLMPYTDF